MTASVMHTAPIASERFQDALPVIPGVVRGPDGLVNISGTRSNQSAMMFNSADGTDPVTGEDAIELPIDAVSTVQVRGFAFAPEFGLSAGAVTTVETQRAGDTWHVTVNDLEPRLRRRAGEFRGIESWTPRFTFGGPLIKGSVNFLESVQYEYSQTRVFGLPAFESDTKVQSFESYSRVDWTVSPTNHFTGSAVVSPRKTTYAGLNTFNPQGVTPNVKNHNVLGSASDQIIVSDKGVFDTRVSVKQFDSTIYPSTGSGVMVLAPDVNSGSYFNNQDRTSRRVEWLNTYSFTPLGPTHLIKVGAGVTHESFDGVSRGGPVQIVRTDVRAGIGMFFSAVPLNVASFDQMQRRIVSSFAEDGATPLGTPFELSNIVLSGLRAPRSVNGNVEVDREWLKNVFVRVGYQQRE